MSDRVWVVWRWPESDEPANKVVFASNTKSACISEIGYHVDDVISNKIGVSSYIVSGKYFVDQLHKASMEDPDMIKDWMQAGAPMDRWIY